MMKHSVSMVLLLFGLMTEAEAQVQLTTSLFYGSPYVWRGEVLSRGYVLQPAVTASYSGFALTAFGNVDPSTGDRWRFNEADLTASYGLQAGPAAVTAGYTLYTFPSMDQGAIDWAPSHEVFGSVTAPELITQPRLFAAYDFNAYEGLYAELGIGHSLPVGDHPVRLGATLGYDAGYVLEPGDAGFSHVALTGSTDLAAGPLVVSPLIGFQISLEDAYRAFQGETFFYGGVNLAF